MKSILRLVLAPIISLIVLVLGNGLFMTFVSLRLGIEGQPPEIIGIVTATFFAGLVIGSVRSHKLIERIGHIRTFAALASLLTALIMIQGIFFNPWAWALIRFCSGYVTAGLYITIESWLLVRSTSQTRGRILSIHMIAFYAALSGGQFLLKIADPKTFLPFAFAIIFAACSVVPVTITKVTAPNIQKASYLNIFKLIKISPLGVTGSFVSGMILGSVYGLNPVFAQKIGISVDGVAAIMGLTIFGGLILQWPLGMLSDFFDRRKIIATLCVLVTVNAILVAIFAQLSLTALLVMITIFGGFTFTIYPLSISHTIDLISDGNDIVAAAGGLYVAYGVGAIIGPTLAPYSMYLLGANGLFYFYALISFILGCYSFNRIYRKAPVPKEDKGSYVNLPTRATPVVPPHTKSYENNDNHSKNT